MDTNKNHSDIKILALIGSAILTLALMFAGVVSAAPQSSTANFVGSDTASEGNWQSQYGADGYAIANGTQNVPSYASLAPQNQLSWTWAQGTTDVRALRTGTNAANLASAWYSSSSFSFDVNLMDGKSHQLALYALDYDVRQRSETIQIVDATSGAVLDTRSISNFNNGIYLVWNVTGHVKANVTQTAGVNAVVSAVFFGGVPAPPVAAVASFLNTDSVTQGNSQAKYGTDGYSIANGAQSVPSYAQFAAQNQLSWTWAASTSDPRALQAGTSAALASTWYNAPVFNFDVNMTDGKSHEFAMYAMDWDSRGRSETIQIVDANSGAALDTRTISGFSNGVYLVWNITGHVKVNVTLLSGVNAVVSGVFFGGSNPSSNNGTSPAITVQPAGQTVTAGQTATFSVANTGTAPMLYQWMKNGAAVSGATSSTYTTLAVAASDNGSQISVTVSNGAGSVTSNPAMLTVNAGTLVLNASATSLSFGNVNVSSSSMQNITLTNTGTANVTISNLSVAGAGFNSMGASAGTILAPGQSTSLNATFAPAVSGNVTGSITVTSNASNGARIVALSGNGIAPVAHAVSLSWAPSTSTVAGYNVYVSTVSGSSYAKLTSSPVAMTDYMDSGLQTAQTRYYVVTAVDSNNDESAFSNEVSAIVP
jgi:hypothetical protein